MTMTVVVAVAVALVSLSVTVAVADQVKKIVGFSCLFDEITILSLKWKRRRHSQLYLWFIIHICALTKQPVHQNESDEVEKDDCIFIFVMKQCYYFHY